jgi:[ribosomal protein S5]-alanine N-acetyltransferase
MNFPDRIETVRLVLRPLDLSDVDAYFAMRSDPEMMRYWEEAEWSLTRTVASMEAGNQVSLALDLKNGESAIGTITLHTINEQCKRCEVGYSLARAHQGLGLMNEAMTAVIGALFGSCGFNRLEADIHPDNEPSRRVLLALGFKREGYLPERWIVGDEVSDSEIFGLLRRDWDPKA